MPPTFAVNHLLVTEDSLVDVTPPLHASVLIRKAFLEHLRENPLRPAIVFWRMRGDFFAPVVAPAHRLVLFVIARDDLCHALLRRHARLDSEVFSWQPKSIPTDRVVALVALLALEARHDIADGVVHGMPDVNTRTTWVIEHAHCHIFGFITGKIGNIGAVFVPNLLPFRLYFLRIVASHYVLVYQLEGRCE